MGCKFINAGQGTLISKNVNRLGERVATTQTPKGSPGI
jgi:hypothetical protein